MTGDELSLDRIVVANGVLFIDVAVKSLLVLAAAGLVAWTLRRRSAALQHGVWTAGFFICAALPAIALIAPAWHLPILPDAMRWNEQDRPSSESLAVREFREAALEERLASGAKTRSPQSRALLPSSDTTAQGFAPPPQPASRQSGPTAAGQQRVDRAQPISSANLSPTWRPLVRLALIGWFVGTATLGLRGVWRAMSLRRFLAACRPLRDRAALEARRSAADQLGYRGLVKLLESPAADGPLTIGIIAPKIVLPADARTWTDERREMVLLHELAHAKRRDVATQTIAAIVCTIHWFNPIAWLGFAQMRRLRELACDDMVVAAGRRPSDYADVLLQVARSYCHRQRALAVGMARGANVETRILAILDRARNRVALSRQAFRLLLASVVVGGSFVGTVRLQSQAEEPAPVATSEESPKADSDKSPAKDDASTAAPSEKQHQKPQTSGNPDPDGRIMQVLITDEAGVPLSGARMVTSIWEMEGNRDYPTKTYVSGEDGVMEVAIPRRLQILRFFPSAPGYVPAFANFAEGSHEEGELIPEKYQFQLQRGTILGGRVVDGSGNPIAGVKVDVSVEVDEPNWGANPPAMICTWLTDADFSGGPVVTDEDGRWSIHCAPAAPPGDDFEFRLKFAHDDYLSDFNWSGLQNEHSVTTEQLRNETAKVVMHRGVEVTGTVADVAGKPITEGLVIWSDNTYFAEGVNEVAIDSTGRFKSPPLPAGKRWLTVLAPGYAPERWEIAIFKRMPEIRFTLQPGRRFAMKVVDQEGNPIPKAYVGIGPWRGVNAVYNEKHPNVPESHIPRHADEQGVYVWDWAPEDAVTYNVSAKGFAAASVALAVKPAGGPHVVELAEPLVAAGKVTDAKTGKPIRKFSVAPVIEFQPGHLSSRLDYLTSGSDGAYELPLRGGGSDSYRYRVRVEADGYRSEVSERNYGTKDGRVAQDFALEPAPARQGQVVDAAGTPVAGAIVVEATMSIAPSIHRNKVGYGDRQIETDGEGRFKVHATTEKYLLRVFHDEAGFAEIVRGPDEPVGAIALQPWAKVSGQVMQQGKPVANELVIVHPVVTPPLGEPRIQGNYQARTDGEGRFKFDRVAPTQFSVRAYLGPWEESPMTSSQSEPLDLQPGEDRSVILGGDGATITGRIVATGRDNAKLDKNWSLSYLISRDRGIALPANFPKLSFDPAQPVESTWFLDPASDDWRASRRNYFVKPSPEGELQINGVPPGTYDLVLRLYEQPAGCLVETIGEKVVTVEVTYADVASGLKEIGEIELPCRSGPRVGQSMAAFKFVDATGKEVHVSDLKGRYVLMHVWASWCGPCLESMPELKSTIKRLAKEPIVFVGLNLDQDAEAGRRVAEREQMDWAQNYLRDDSDLARQLAISSAPTYYLIGPDGNLAASATEWSVMKAQLDAAFGE